MNMKCLDYLENTIAALYFSITFRTEESLDSHMLTFKIKSLPWKDWFRQHSARDLEKRLLHHCSWKKIVVECLPLYRSITRCSVVNCVSTAFWKGKWIPGRCFADKMLLIPQQLKCAASGNKCNYAV
jgi:hypothetical protein